MTDIYEALRLAIIAAIEEYKFVRHLQKGGNPDVLPF
jgi:hypothetical protein